jgi:hypothetical protein
VEKDFLRRAMAGWKEGLSGVLGGASYEWIGLRDIATYRANP